MLEVERPLLVEDSESPAGVERPGRVPAWAVLAALVAVSAAVRFLAGLQIPSPWFTPDELLYGELGKSLYRHGHFEILGATPDFYGLVFPALVGLPLSLSDLELGYVLLKAAQAVVMSLVALPVYLWGRTLMSPRWSLVAAALSLSIPALAFVGFIMTEVAFYPIGVLAAWAMARALVRPTLGRQALLGAAMLLAVLTRLQAVALVPVLVLAVGLQAVFERTWLRGFRAFLPAFGGIAVAGAVWIGASSAFGGKALGAYETTREVSYGVWRPVRFVGYHAADLLLMTAVLPTLAVVILAVGAFAGRERSRETRAYLAVALAYSAVFLVLVGVFASRLVGHLAERNLIVLAPLLFIGFALWLDRGAPRPRVTTAAVALAALAAVAVAPWRDLAVPAVQPDAFTMIPLVRITQTYPDVSLRLVVVLGAAELLALFVFVPRRFTWALPAVTLVLLAAASISASRVVASQARGFQSIMVGPENRWIDRAAPGEVAFLYGGELGWSAGAPAWVNLFWNRSVEEIYLLFGTHVAGLPVQPRLSVAPDGRLRLADGHDAAGRYAVASTRLALFGTPVATTPSRLALWRVDGPIRLASRLEGRSGATGLLGPRVSLTVYDCRRGALRLALVAPDDRTVEVRQQGATLRRVSLRAGALWEGDVPATGNGGRCAFSLAGAQRVRADRFEFARTG